MWRIIFPIFAVDRRCLSLTYLFWVNPHTPNGEIWPQETGDLCGVKHMPISSLSNQSISINQSINQSISQSNKRWFISFCSTVCRTVESKELNK